MNQPANGNGSRCLQVAFLTNRTSTISLPLLDALARSRDAVLCHVLFYDTVSAARKSWRRLLREQGLANLLVKALAMLRLKIATWTSRTPDRALRRHIFCHDYAVSRGLPMAVFADLNQPAVVSWLAEQEIDILVVCSCRQILQGPLLATPRLGCVNVHPSLLPKFRGPMPVFWALYEGEATTGVTFHVMSEKIDGGDVLAQFPVPIHPTDDEESLQERLFREAAARVETVLRDYAAGQLPPQPQRATRGSYRGYPTPQQRRKLVRWLATKEQASAPPPTG